MIYKRIACSKGGTCNRIGPRATCSKCGERRPDGIYWYKFMWQGRLVRESTKQCNDKVARQMESAHRTSLAKGEVGLREKKAVPTLTEFIEKRFEPWVESVFSAKPKTRLWYRNGTRRLLSYAPVASSLLNQITGESVSAYVAHRRSCKLEISSVNPELQVLRRALRVAAEWGVIESAPKVKMLPGERHRERVVSPEEEARYLAAAQEPLASVAAVLVDTGMRPEECFRLRWESITWVNGRYGTLLVTHGKTAAARRMLPMTPRVRAILESRWEVADKPTEGWVWPAPTRSGHIESSSLRKQHDKAFEIIALEAAKRSEKPVRPFVLYSLRHTFLTRLGEAGCDVWTLARIAGHSSIGVSARYVHPSEDAVLDAISRLGGHKIGHTENQAPQLPVATQGTNAVQ
jgi:integrase